MEEELKNFIKVWVCAIICLSYCFYIPTRIKAGVFRLLSVLPVCVLFLVLPLFFSSVHFSGSAVMFLSWLANSKLILFSFDQGPLFPLPQNLTLFICYTCLPIKPQQSPTSHRTQQHLSQDLLPKLLFAIKVVLFSAVLHMYDYIQNLPPILLLVLYPLHLYLALEILFNLIRFLSTFALGCDLEPPFNEPYLATSLQDFWGRRWNRMISGILRSTVYNPMRKVSGRVLNYDLAMFIGMFLSFLVSGLVHELIFFNLTREAPTWEVTWYFVLHGVSTVVEVAVKRKTFVRRWRVIPVMSQLLTVGFVILTSGWLFFPNFKRTHVMERFADESLLLIDFVTPRWWFEKQSDAKEWYLGQKRKAIINKIVVASHKESPVVDVIWYLGQERKANLMRHGGKTYSSSPLPRLMCVSHSWQTVWLFGQPYQRSLKTTKGVSRLEPFPCKWFEQSAQARVFPNFMISFMLSPFFYQNLNLSSVVTFQGQDLNLVPDSFAKFVLYDVGRHHL